MKYPILLFDFDGTLYDTSKTIASVVGKTRKRFDLPELGFDYIISNVGKGVENLINNCFGDCDKDSQEVYELFTETYLLDDSSETFLEPGLEAFLENDTRIKIIVSNKSEVLIKKTLSIKNTSKYFTHVIGGDTFDFKKPDPRLLDELKKIHPEGNKNFLMIGDDLPDIKFAQNAGINFVYCNFGFRGDKYKANHDSIDSYQDLTNFLNK